MTGIEKSAQVLTFDRAVERIRDAARGREDYVNVPSPGEETCVYVNPDGSPSCIVGAAFYPEIVRAYITFTSDINRKSVHILLTKALRMPCTEAAMSFLENVQTSQDNGATWGQAIHRALEITYPPEETP